MKSIAISRPNNSPATRVNLLIMEQAPKMASKNSNNAVQTHILQDQKTRPVLSIRERESKTGNS